MREATELKPAVRRHGELRGFCGGRFRHEWSCCIGGVAAWKSPFAAPGRSVGVDSCFEGGPRHEFGHLLRGNPDSFPTLRIEAGTLRAGHLPERAETCQRYAVAAADGIDYGFGDRLKDAAGFGPGQAMFGCNLPYKLNAIQLWVPLVFRAGAYKAVLPPISTSV